MYNPHNIFARILRNELPYQKVYENNAAIALKDINPLRKVHILVIPKRQVRNFDDFITAAEIEEVRDFWQAVKRVIDLLGLAKTGYRLITNTGRHGHQEIEHFHVHVLGGEAVGAMVQTKS